MALSTAHVASSLICAGKGSATSAAARAGLASRAEVRLGSSAASDEQLAVMAEHEVRLGSSAASNEQLAVMAAREAKGLLRHARSTRTASYPICDDLRQLVLDFIRQVALQSGAPPESFIGLVHAAIHVFDTTIHSVVLDSASAAETSEKATILAVVAWRMCLKNDSNTESTMRCDLGYIKHVLECAPRPGRGVADLLTRTAICKQECELLMRHPCVFMEPTAHTWSSAFWCRFDSMTGNALSVALRACGLPFWVLNEQLLWICVWQGPSSAQSPHYARAVAAFALVLVKVGLLSANDLQVKSSAGAFWSAALQEVIGEPLMACGAHGCLSDCAVAGLQFAADTNIEIVIASIGVVFRARLCVKQ